MRIEEFLDYLRLERNYSALTVLKYETCLRLFEVFFRGLGTGLEWETVDSDVIRDWMELMMDEGEKATTVNGKLSAVRSFYRFALRKGLVSHDPAHNVTGPKKEKQLPKFIREKDMDRLLSPEMWSDEYKDVCARTLLITFYESGMRVAELVSLDDEMVDFVNHQLKVTGKRNKQRIIPFGEEMERALLDYVALRDEQVIRQESGFFLSDKGKRMNIPQVRRIVKQQLGRVTTQKKRSPHVLRHSFATAMLNHEAGLESVKKLLGHESLATTEIYTHTTFEQLKKVYNKAHPRS